MLLSYESSSSKEQGKIQTVVLPWISSGEMAACLECYNVYTRNDNRGSKHQRQNRLQLCINCNCMCTKVIASVSTVGSSKLLMHVGLCTAKEMRRTADPSSR